MLKEQIDSLLDRVQKPARYMGGEMNCVLKDPNSVDIRYAFAFPDVYEVGMSHLGSRILYDIINKREDALCERVFMPWVDMADLMRQEGVPLFSLETRSPIGGFDMLGVTLQYEMSYTNILEMLDLAGIPLRSEDRTWDHPIVIAGGPCAFNPEPLYAFIDAFSIGDGEISTLETIDVVKQCKQEGVSREECLRRLSRLHGVYVPSLYRASYNEDGTLASFEPTEEGVPRTVVKNMIANIDTAAYPESIIVPFMEIVHDRINIEVLRGCTRGCRFCQAGMIYRPVRERSVEHLLELAQKLVDSTGYEEITLSSLSTGDYTCLPELAHKLMDKFQEERIALSLPSLRLDSKLKETLEETQKVRKTSLTYAMEAGTQRLRDVINKGITEENLMSSVSDAFAGGWSSVKLYFMFACRRRRRRISTVLRIWLPKWFASILKRRRTFVRAVCASTARRAASCPSRLRRSNGNRRTRLSNSKRNRSICARSCTSRVWNSTGIRRRFPSWRRVSRAATERWPMCWKPRGV